MVEITPNFVYDGGEFLHGYAGVYDLEKAEIAGAAAIAWKTFESTFVLAEDGKFAIWVSGIDPSPQNAQAPFLWTARGQGDLPAAAVIRLSPGECSGGGFTEQDLQYKAYSVGCDQYLVLGSANGFRLTYKQRKN